MGTECLGPKRTIEDVYIKIIKSIYQDSQYLDLHQANDPSSFNKFQEKLTKQGDLRKFVENLSSRKSKIQEALALNYRLCVGNKKLGGSYSGLIILNSISDVAYPNRQQIESETTKKSDFSSHRSSSKNILRLVRKNSNEEEKKEKDRNRQKIEEMVHRGVMPEAIVDCNYFKLIKVLYSRDELKGRTMESVISFCTRHPGAIACEVELWAFIGVLVQDLKKDDLLRIRIKTLRSIFLKTKDQITQSMRNREMIIVILKLWLQAHRKPEEAETEHHCHEILNKIFGLFIQAWESEFLCECLFSVFDAIEFQSPDQEALEELCEDFIQSAEEKQGFQRYIFNYLLSYLVFSQSHNPTKKWQQLLSLGINTENAKILYKNSEKGQIQLACLRKMNDWLDKRYIELSQLHNMKLLLHVFVCILLSHTSAAEQVQIEKQYAKIIHKMSQEGCLDLLQAMQEEMQDNERTWREQALILRLARLLIHYNRVPKSEISQVLTVIPLLKSDEQERKREAINFNIFVITELNPSKSSQSHRKKQDFWQNIADYFCSFYDIFIAQEINLTNKLQLLCSHHELVNQLERLKQKHLLTAYLEIICNKSQSNHQKVSIQAQYCLLSVGFHLRRTISGEKLPDKFDKLESLLNKGSPGTQTGLLNEYFFSPDPFFIINKNEENAEYLQCQRILHRTFTSSYFYYNQKNSTQKKNGFSHSISIAPDSDTRSLNDISFADAIDILNQK